MKAVPDSEELIRERVAEARQLSVAAPILLPLLEARKLSAYQKLLADYRDGKPISHNHIATLFVIESIQGEVRNKLEDLSLVKE